MNLQTPITELGRSFKMFGGRLAKLDIFTVKDLIYHIPSRYENFSIISPINKIQPGEVLTIQGEVTKIQNIYTKRFKKIQEAKVQDTTGEIDVLWFNQPYIIQSIHVGDKISLAGRVEKQKNKLQLVSPDFEIITNNNPIHTGRLVPIYPETKGISSKWLRRQIYKIIYENQELFNDYIPYSIIEDYHMINLKDAIEQIHFPKELSNAQKAKERLAFDEVFLLQLAAYKRRAQWQSDKITQAFELTNFKNNIQVFWEKLPFELTNAQRKVIHEIFQDIQKNTPMNRLVQGDVGSGKTVVAASAMYLAYLNGFQSAFMAPTEILAEQHYKTISNLLSPLGVKIQLRTGSKKGIKNQELRIKGKNIQNTKYKIPDTNIMVGTHALISENVQFNKLGLVVIDEQHRFGVEQRAILKQKGNNPHLLTMTATPIPRTVALTLYGDLDLSVIDEMPKNRKTIKTWLVPNVKREAGYQWIAEQIAKGDQAFIVCPFIEESENMTTVKAATKEFEHLQKDVFPKLKLGMLHGKMKAKEKDAVLNDFRDKKIDILVATPVVEVGIDIPNATIIVIEASERFGLAQLHQLRGRVGRGEKQSYCLLFTESLNDMTRTRLANMQHIHNGAELAELDLKMRGAGDIYGTRQSGQRMLKIASFSDIPLIEKAKKIAYKIYPELDNYPELKKKVEEITISQVTPN